MKQILFICLVSSSICVCYGQTGTDKAAVDKLVTSYFNSWNNHDFKDMISYTTEDFDLISPVGTWLKGRSDAQKSLQHLHDTMLKNTPLTELSTTTRFVTPSVAIVTVISKTGTFYFPDGVDNGQNKHGDNRAISTMVMVKKNDKWLLVQLIGTDINEYVIKTDPLSRTPQ